MLFLVIFLSLISQDTPQLRDIQTIDTQRIAAFRQSPKLSFNERTLLRWKEPTDDFFLLRNETAIDEIDCTEGQIKKMRELLSEYEELQKSLVKKLHINRQSSIIDFQKDLLGIKAKLDDALVPNQLKRLKEIKNRCVLTRYGFARLLKLNRGQLPEEPSPMEDRLIGQRDLDFFAKMQVEFDLFAKESLATLLRKLEPQTKKSILASFKISEDSALDFDTLKLSVSELLAAKRDSSMPERSFEDLITKPRGYKLNSFNQFRIMKSAEISYSTAVLPWLISFINQNQGSIEGESVWVTEQQQTEFKLLKEQIARQIEENNAEFNRRFDAEGESASLLRDLKRRNSELDSSVKKAFNEILIRHQTKQMTERLRFFGSVPLIVRS